MAGSISAPVDLANLALSQIGARATISSLNPSDGTVAGDACSLLYQPTIDAFSRAAHWNCCRFQVQLSLLKAAAGTPENPNGTTLPVPPIGFWLYEYALPEDCLKARYLVPQLVQRGTNPPLTTAGSLFLPWRLRGTALKFQVGVDFDTSNPPNETAVLYCNLGTILTGPPSLVYTRRMVNVGLFDAGFVMGAKAALGTWLVNPVNASAAMMQQAMGIAKAMLDQARLNDGNEGINADTINDTGADWIAFRYGGIQRATGLWIAPFDSFAFADGSSY